MTGATRCFGREESEMSQTLPLPAGFDALTVEEQIDYIQSLWDRIAAQPEQVPVPDWASRDIERTVSQLSSKP